PRFFQPLGRLVADRLTDNRRRIRSRGIFQRYELFSPRGFHDGPALGHWQYVEDEHLEFQGVLAFRLDPRPGLVQVRHLFAGDVKRKAARTLGDLGQEIKVEDVDGGAAGPDAQLAVFVRLTA